MTEETTQNITQKDGAASLKSVTLTGQLYRKPAPEFIRVIMVVTGFAVLAALWQLIIRFLLVIRKTAKISFNSNHMELNIKYSIFFKNASTADIIIPADKILSVQTVNRVRHMQLVTGLGFLTAGLFAGVHWLLNGLGAGYPYLALIGAMVIILGFVLDLLLFLFVPDSKGTASVIIETKNWSYRITGVDEQQALQFVRSVKKMPVPAAADKSGNTIKNSPAVS